MPRQEWQAVKFQNVENHPAFHLRADSLPSHLRPNLNTYDYCPVPSDRIAETAEITTDAWPGLHETLPHDLTARQLVNAAMLGAINKKTGEIEAYLRQEFGYFVSSSEQGIPIALSHMTAVREHARDKGHGQALKWALRQSALEFPEISIEVATWTYDPAQGRNARVNLHHLGLVCGAAGGYYKEDAYSQTDAKQHQGNPMDRFQGVWYLDSDWVLARLEGKVVNLKAEEIEEFPVVISTKPDRSGFLVPASVNTLADSNIIKVATPYDWDAVVQHCTQEDDYQLATNWRYAHRQAFHHYMENGYTAIDLITDRSKGINYILMAKDFNPYNPPSELLE